MRLAFLAPWRSSVLFRRWRSCVEHLRSCVEFWSVMQKCVMAFLLGVLAFLRGVLKRVHLNHTHTRIIWILTILIISLIIMMMKIKNMIFIIANRIVKKCFLMNLFSCCDKCVSTHFVSSPVEHLLLFIAHHHHCRPHVFHTRVVSLHSHAH